MKHFVLLTGLLLAAAPAMAQTNAPQPSPYDKAPWWMKESVITQTGYVFTELPANRASFSASFQTTDDTADKAQSKAIAQTKALMQALDGLGKDAVRVTTGFSMRTLYEQYRDKDGNKVENQRGDKINGYQVSLNLNVEVRDVRQLEHAYALALAASPDSTSPVNFNLQPDNATNTWLYSEAIKDAHTRALQAAAAAGAKLGAVKVIDPTGRACETDILARQRSYDDDGMSPQYAVIPPPVVDAAPPPPIPVPPVPGSAEALEAKALQNPFIQTPPIRRLESKACVVYALD
jgi:uncharacterized protein YggE